MGKVGNYRGTLATPISGGLSDQGVEKEIHRKLRILCKHYDITGTTIDSQLAQLAVALAFEHVPGFSFRRIRRMGRPQKWDRLALLVLFMQVKKKERERGRGALDAVRAIAKSHFPKNKQSTIYRKYMQARSQWGTDPGAPLRAFEDVVLRPRGAWTAFSKLRS